ncbi:MAG TPA: MFS transporter [Acidimicrobiales bacterium]|nr:MFS transporter [Acidimicrobiales bacterium]
MGEVFRRPAFRALFIGQAISGFGDWMVTVALMALVLRVSGSSTAVGGVLLLRLLPAAAAAPFAARGVRGWDRRRTMQAADLVRAGIVVAIPLVAALWWVYVCAFLLEAAGIVFLPARDSLIPDLVERDQLSLANSAILVSSYGSIPFGAAAFGAVAALSPGGGWLGGHPFVLVFFLDAVTFVVSFLFVSRLPKSSEEASRPSDEPQARFRDALRIPLVRMVMTPTAAIVLALGSLFSLGVVYVRDVLGASDTQFGLMIALFGVGAAIGLGALQLARDHDHITNIRHGVIVQGATVALMSLANGIALAFVGAVAFGAATAFVLASGMSALQSMLEGHERVLAFTAFHVVIRAGLSLSAIAAGVAGDVIGDVRVPVVGVLEPARLVLLCAGALVLVTAPMLRSPTTTEVAVAGLHPH